MTNLSAVSTSSPVTAVTTTRNASTPGAVSNATSAPSYTFVTLGGSNAAASAQLYSMSGAAPSTDKFLSWQSKSNDAVSTMMAGNFSASSLGARFKGLGAALLNRFDSDGGNFSQSVVTLPAGTPKGSALESTLRTQTNAQTDNKISLTIVTSSGAQVDLTLANQEDGLSVQVQVSKGKLTDAERGALQKLSDGFQSAIDGIAANPPRLKLDGLTQFDTSLLASVDLHASVQVGSAIQTIDFHADSKQRTVSAAGPAGTLKVSVDLSNLAMVEARLDTGETLLALNEIFVGHRSHQSAIYELRHGPNSERQSSSGLIVSSGTGATGWARSIMTATHHEVKIEPCRPEAIYFVREAWPSRTTSTRLAVGRVSPKVPVEVTSRMEGGGVVFADGIEQDFLRLDWGTPAASRSTNAPNLVD